MTSARASSLLAGMALAVAGVAPAQQQVPAPHVGYVYPAGGRRGATFTVRMGGQFLGGVRAAMASGAGVRLRVLDHDRLRTPQELTALRDTAQALQRELRQKGSDPAIRQRLLAIVELVNDWQRRRANPALSEIVTLEVSIDSDAALGARRVRLQTPLGVTNPLVFQVDSLPELVEPEGEAATAGAALPITLPVIVNGRLVPGSANRGPPRLRAQAQYLPGDVDRYRFAARRGQRLVAMTSARALMPYLGDAVPGWFQATLTLRDARGREVAYDDDFRFDPDPVLEYDVPADGEYVLEIRDALYRGRDDFVYRVAIGELPFVTSAFPLGGRAGARTTVALAGWNLPTERAVIAPTEHGLSMQSIGAGAAGSASASFEPRFAVDTLPEVLEREPNDVPSRAQLLTLPVVVNGRVDRPGDRDMYNFEGRAGDTVVAEVYARRLGSPLDAVVELTDATGRRLAWNDDHDDRVAGLETHHADSWLMARLPTSGTYRIRVADVQGKGGAAFAYRLRLGAPRPDFELRVSPSSIDAAAGSTVPVTVTAIRRDGFDGDIVVALQDAPRGFVLSGGVVPAGQDQTRMTLTIPVAIRPGAQSVPADPVRLGIVGSAAIGGRTVVRQALAADDMMQAFFYHHLVVADGPWVSVIGRGGTRAPVRLMSEIPLRIACGGRAPVRVALPPGYQAIRDLTLRLSDPPDGVTLGDVAIDARGATFTLAADASKLGPGRRGNIIVEMIGEVPRPPNAKAPATQPPPRLVLGALPAIPFEIVK